MMAPYAPTATPLSDAALRQRLTDYAAGCSSEVRVDGIIPFANQYYARLVAADGSGIGEIVVDRFTGTVYPEPGPTMMWNGRYGVAGTTSSGTATYDEATAKQLATAFLTGYLPGASVIDGQAFPGYFTFSFGQDAPVGLLSVNASTGAVWVHSWQGAALQTAN